MCFVEGSFAFLLSKDLILYFITLFTLVELSSFTIYYISNSNDQ